MAHAVLHSHHSSHARFRRGFRRTCLHVVMEVADASRMAVVVLFHFMVEVATRVPQKQLSHLPGRRLHLHLPVRVGCYGSGLNTLPRNVQLLVHGMSTSASCTWSMWLFAHFRPFGSVVCYLVLTGHTNQSCVRCMHTLYSFQAKETRQMCVA